MAERFARVNGTSPELDRAQRRIQEGYGRGNPPFQDGAQITVRITTDMPKLAVSHKLGRKLQGFKELTRTGDGAATLMMNSSTNKQAEFALKGAAGVSHTYTLWVF